MAPPILLQRFKMFRSNYFPLAFALFFLCSVVPISAAHFYSDPPEAKVESSSANAKATNAPAIKVSTVKQVISETLELANVVFSTGSNSFSFLPSPGWRLTQDQANKKLTLSYSNGQKYLIVELIETGLKEISEIKSANIVQYLKRKYPGLIVVEEFPVASFNHDGLGFSIKWPSPGGKEREMRHATVGFPGGMLEITMVAVTESPELFHDEFNRLLLSFRYSPGSKVGFQKVLPE